MDTKERSKDADDPLAGAQYGPSEPPSRAQKLLNAITDADYYGAMQSLGPTGYGVGGLTGVAGKAGRAAKEVSKPKKMASGGSVKSASRRADGIAQRGKTRGRMV